MKFERNTNQPKVIFFAKVDKKFQGDWEYYEQDIRLLRESGFDVVLCSSYRSILLNIWKANFVYAWWWHRSLPVVLFARLLHKKVIVTGAVHAFDLSGAPHFGSKGLFYRTFTLLALRMASLNLCISRHQQQSLQMLSGSVKCRILYPSVDKRLDTVSYVPVIVNRITSICWLSFDQCKRKGIFRAINAISLINKSAPELLEKTKYTIAGKVGDGLDLLEKLIREKQLENFIDIRLNLNVEEKYSLLRNSDLLLAPSAMEGFGNATLEAMSVGVPCLVTSEGASKEVVSDSGLVVLGIDEEEIAASLCQYLSYDDDRKRQLKRASLARANDYFNFEKRVADFKEILSDLRIIR